MKIILDAWSGAEGCLATDRILVDGEKVGYSIGKSLTTIKIGIADGGLLRVMRVRNTWMILTIQVSTP